MNNLIMIIIILIFSIILCFNNSNNNGVVNASTLQSTIIDNYNNINCNYSIITVIVDPSKLSPSNYTCGDENNTFRSVGDVLSYFDTIKTIQDPNGQTWIYQQLNIKLVDGQHSVDSINIFLYNLTISPLINGSTNVSISGPGITIFTYNKDAKRYVSSLSISGVNFKINSYDLKFSTVSASESIVYVTYDRCTFDISLSKLFVLFSITGSILDSHPPSVYVTISNCIANGIPFKDPNYLPVIDLFNGQLTIVNTDFISISGSINIIKSTHNSILIIDNCSFNNITLPNSLFYLLNTKFEIHNSDFINNQNNASLGVVLYLDNSNGIISGSNFTDNYQIIVNSTKPLISGPLFTTGSQLSVSTSYFSSKHIPNSLSGQIVTSYSESNVSFDNCTFVANDQYAYACLNGNLTFTNCNVKPLFFCSGCNHGSINNVEYCKHDSSSNSMFKSSSLPFIYFVSFIILILNIL